MGGREERWKGENKERGKLEEIKATNRIHIYRISIPEGRNVNIHLATTLKILQVFMRICMVHIALVHTYFVFMPGKVVSHQPIAQFACGWAVIIHDL